MRVGVGRAQEYYTASEAGAFRSIIRLVRDLDASTPACAFTPRRLELVRDAMIDKGCGSYLIVCRLA